MWGKSAAENGTKTTGPMMLLKSLGFDSDEFMSGINSARAEYEAAKAESIKVVHHFDGRFDAIELRLSRMESTQIETLKMLSLVVSSLKVQEQPDATEQNEIQPTFLDNGKIVWPKE